MPQPARAVNGDLRHGGDRHEKCARHFLQHIRNQFACRRQVAKNQGDEAAVRRIDQEERETLELLSQPAVRVFHGARPGEIINI